MGHDVFICYSSADRTVADAACATLEATGVRCWIAPRDPLPGLPYSGQLVEAISQSRILLLILSANANESGPVLNELEVASHLKKLILPFRIEEIAPSGNLEFYIRSMHWLDALPPPIAEHFPALVARIKQILEGPADQPERAMGKVLEPEPVPNNLPAQISSFVGRKKEQAELRALLEKHRLVTIAGPGGIGKTRVALQVAAQVFDRFPDGVYFVDLAPLRDGTLVTGAVASALRVAEVPGQTIERTVQAALEPRRALLLLDNAEQLHDDVATFAKSLLSACPDLVVLVTSREPLHVGGEQVYRLLPLEDGPQLFEERADLTQPAGPAEQADIAELCELLDNIPLAIELAAARTNIFSVAQLREHLGAPLSFLISKDPTEDPRHRTLRNAIEWSYGLLDDAERRFLDQLSIFQGPFSFAACQEIVNASAADLIESLVDKSLLTIIVGESEQRFRLLDTVRQFAAEKLPANERERLEAAHFAYFLKLSTDEHGDGGPEQANWLNVVDADIHDIRGSLERGFQREDPETLDFLRGLARYWRIRGHIKEGRTWLARAIQTAAFEGQPLYPAILRRASTLATIVDDHGEAKRLTTEALRRYEAMKDVSGAAEALFNLGVIAQRSGKDTAARDFYQRALTHFRSTNHIRGTVLSLINLSQIAIGEADFRLARRLLDECDGPTAELADENLSATLLMTRGSLAMRSGDLDNAQILISEALQVNRAMQAAPEVIECLNDLAAVHIRRGDLSSANSLLRESLSSCLIIDSLAHAADALERFSALLHAMQKSAKAAELLGLAQSLRHGARFEYEHDEVRQLRVKLGHDFPEALARGKSSDWRSTTEALLRQS